MRLIDADKLKTSLNETVDAAIKWHEDCLGEIMQNRSEAAITAFIEFILRLKEQPTVDAVEVIRCGDCLFWNEIPSNTVTPEYHKCKLLGIQMAAHDYCSRGRREDAKIH